MNTEHRFHRLQQRQGAAEKRQGDPTIGRLLESMERKLTKVDARLSACINAWRAELPEELVRQTRLKTYSRGVLTVIVENPGVAYEIDRCLRGGAQKAIRAQLSFTLTRIRTEVGALDPSNRPARSGRMPS